MPEIVGLTIGLVLTICVYSYILGDNPLYRLAVHVLVGVSSAYAVLITIQAVIMPAFTAIIRAREQAFATQATTDYIFLGLSIVPIFLGLFIFIPRDRPLAARINNISVAILIGIGAAVALVGAILGTILPQIIANAPDPILALVTTILTACTLLYFQFNLQSNPAEPAVVPLWQQILGRGLGRAVLMMTFGALFALTLNSSLTLLTSQLNQMLEFVFSLSS